MKLGVTIAPALFIITIPILHGQRPVSKVDLSCVDALELPTRGLSAAGARESGVVDAVAHIGKDGRLSRLQLAGGNRALQGEVRVAMNLSKFAAACHDRMIEFVFSFTLEGPPVDSILPPGVRFVPPNRFELVFRQLKPIYDVAPPQPASKH